MRVSAIAAALTILLLAACVSADFRSREVDFQLPLADGVTRLFFVQSVHEMNTRAVDVDVSGNVLRDLRVLTDERLGLLRAGITGDDVVAEIGPPYRKIVFERQNQTTWDYRYRDNWGYIVEFSFMLDTNNIVASKASRRIEPGRDDH